MRKKKIKILHVAQAAGGVDRYIRMLLKYLDSKGLVCIDPSWFKMAATLFDLEISIPTANIDIPSFVSIYGYPAFPKYAHIQS